MSKAEVHTILIERNFTPKLYQGDVVFFSSTDTASALTPPWQIWQDYVKGKIVVHRVPHPHHEMLNLQPAAMIGSLLAEELERQYIP